MNDLTLHPTTEKQLSIASKRPIHAYLFVGSDGLGKTTAAHRFASKALGDGVDRGDLDRWIYQLSPVDGKKISVAQVKQMAKFANQSKSSSVRAKVIIIDQANIMSIEAANSLLSILEEAPIDTIFILVANSIDGLPTTIVSRLQIVRFYEPSTKQVLEFAKTHGIENAVVKDIGNYPAKLLVSQNDDQRDKQGELVSRFVSGDLIARLIVVSELSDRTQVEMFLCNLARKLVGGDSEHTVRLGESLLLAQSHLYNSGNPKFVLENLALEFE